HRQRASRRRRLGAVRRALGGGLTAGDRYGAAVGGRAFRLARSKRHFTASFAGSNSALISAGISASGVGRTSSAPFFSVTQWFTLPNSGSRFVYSSREWAPRLSLRSSALRAT